MASTTLLADSQAGERGGVLPWALLVTGSAASLVANVAVAQPTAAGRMIAAWPSFALIGAYELLMRQVRRSASSKLPSPKPQAAGILSRGCPSSRAARAGPPGRTGRGRERVAGSGAGRELQRQAWQWALAHRAGDGSLPSGRAIAAQYGRHERWGRLAKRAGNAGEFSSEPALRLVGQLDPGPGSAARPADRGRTVT